MVLCPPWRRRTSQIYPVLRAANLRIVGYGTEPMGGYLGNVGTVRVRARCVPPARAGKEGRGRGVGNNGEYSDVASSVLSTYLWANLQETRGGNYGWLAGTWGGTIWMKLH